jgi:poly(beta-D-mannuronate) lyase
LNFGDTSGRRGKIFQPLPVLILAGILFAPPVRATTYYVGGTSTLTTALAAVNPGDSIVMSNGNYSGFTITRSGTAANPITIQSLNLGGATNNSGIIKFAGVSNVVLSGLTLTTSGGSLTVDGTARNVGVVLTNCVNCRVTRCNFKMTGIASGTAWCMIGGPSFSNRVDHCDFGPNSIGTGVHFIWPVGNATISGVSNPSDRTPWAMGYGPFNPNMARYTRVDHNYFHDQASGVGEIMVLGAIGMTGDYQDGFTTVEYNLFENCDGDPEIISSKSSGNTLRYNTVRSSAGVFSLRAGNHCSVYGNFFLCAGSGGGVKMSERDHKIFNNYIENSDSSAYPLMLEGGDLYNSGFSHAQVVRAKIVHNTIVNAGRQTLFAHGSGLPVTDTVFANNICESTGSGTIYNESAISVNPVFASNIAWNGTDPAKSGFSFADPLLTTVNGLQKLSGSGPAMNVANANYFPFVADDLDGQARNSPADIGADDYFSAGTFIARAPLTTNEVGPNAVDIELSASPVSRAVSIGLTNVSYTITVTADVGFTNVVTLNVSGLLRGLSGAPGMTAGFNPPTVNGSGTVTLNVTNGFYSITGAPIPGGDYPLTITATSSNLASSVTADLQVGRGASNLRWTSGGSGAWDVQNSANWFNVTSNKMDAFYNGDFVLLDDTNGVQTNLTIAAGVAVSPSAVTNSSSTNNFTISGAGKITGATKFVKTGTSTLTMNTTNDFGGGMLIAGGTLKPGNPFALGGQGGFIIVTNGATLDVNGFNLGYDTVLVSGAGVSNNGAIINNGADIYPALALVELAGDTTIGGTHRWDLRASGGTSGDPTTASLSTSGNAFNLTKTGVNFFGLCSATVDPALGNVNVQAGTFNFEGNTTGLGLASKTLTIYSNATFEMWAATNWLNKKIALNDGANFQNGSGANIVLGPVTLNGRNTFVIGGTSLTLSNVLGGPGRLIKTGNSILNLAAANIYSGNTTVSNGSVVLSGSISSSLLITVAAGATFDASARSDGTLTLNNGQTLAGSGTVKGNVIVGNGAMLAPGSSIGTLTLNNNLTLAGGSTTSMELSKAPVTNDMAQVSGSVNYGGTLMLTNLSGIALANGDSFKLFSAANYSGAFTNIVPAIPGINLAWNTNGLTNGILSVIAAPTAPPIISAAQLTGNLFVLSGSNGVANWPCYLLATTDLGLPASQWPCVATNMFDGGGNCSFTNALVPDAPRQYYLLKLQ